MDRVGCTLYARGRGSPLCRNDTDYQHRAVSSSDICLPPELGVANVTIAILRSPPREETKGPHSKHVVESRSRLVRSKRYPCSRPTVGASGVAEIGKRRLTGRGEAYLPTFVPVLDAFFLALPFSICRGWQSIVGRIVGRTEQCMFCTYEVGVWRIS